MSSVLRFSGISPDSPPISADTARKSHAAALKNVGRAETFPQGALRQQSAVTASTAQGSARPSRAMPKPILQSLAIPFWEERHAAANDNYAP